MEGKQKTYLIYKIIAPIGQSYIGYTSMSLEERWRNHKYNALKNYRKGHPFYDAIRKYPLDSFKLMVLEKTNNRLKALKLEEKYIKENKGELSMNLSAGGISKAQKKHMESLSADERKKVTIKARESIDRKKQGEAASKGLKKWWEELRKNPQEYEDYINRRKQTNLEKGFKHENL